MGPLRSVLAMIVGSGVTMLLSLVYFHHVDLAQSIIRNPQENGLVYFSSDPLQGSFLNTSQEKMDKNKCFPLNSDRWLNTERVGNLEDPRMDGAFISNMILDGISSMFSKDETVSSLLNQTLCHKDSLFLAIDESTTRTPEALAHPTNDTIRAWSVRLIYLATFLHQHVPAVEEAKLRIHHYRMGDRCQFEWSSKKVGAFDYECPSSKFLVVSMGRLGLGAVMRLGVVNALIAGISLNRTVLVVNNAPVGSRFLREPWLLTSCPRRDMQCFYMPMTPCVLTTNDITNAPTLERGHARALFRSGRLPGHLEEERVILLDMVLRPQRTPYAFRERIVQIVQEHIIQPLEQKSVGAPTHQLVPVLKQAASSILEEEQLEDGSYYYFGHNSRHNHALVFYAMRPNLKYANKLNAIIQDIIPRDLDPDHTFGVPIRDSDKCDKESECLPFHQYMNMTRQTYSKYYKEQMAQTQTDFILENDRRTALATATIIVTSESVQIHDAMAQYEDEGRHKRELPFSARFVRNHFDLHQGTGNPGRTDSANMSMDDVMLSAVSSLQAQLHARYTLGNCCSNFHLLLFDFLRDGCGAASRGGNQVAECMQDNEDPSFRLCCYWSKKQECAVKRAASN